jgi:hypothetical protein
MPPKIKRISPSASLQRGFDKTIKKEAEMMSGHSNLT